MLRTSHDVCMQAVKIIISARLVSCEGMRGLGHSSAAVACVLFFFIFDGGGVRNVLVAYYLL